MPRPHKPRCVRHDPAVVHFKPAGVPVRELEEVALGLDELEALRLSDVEGLSQEQVGKLMDVSRATVGRILAEARRKTAAALVHGWAIKVEGGPVAKRENDMPRHDGTGPRGRGPRTGRGRGPCEKKETPQDANPQEAQPDEFRGRGRGRGPGCGQGRRRGGGGGRRGGCD
jgi:predicted DNA-binding protein (UPF0251 family)